MVYIPSTTQAAKFSWAKNISSDRHCNDSTRLDLSLTTSANAYLMSVLSIVNAVWTLQLFFEIKPDWSDLRDLNFDCVTAGNLVFSGASGVRSSLRCPCTIDWQFSRPARLIFPSGPSRPIGNIRTHRVRVETIFGRLPCTLACLPRARPFSLSPTTSKRLLRRLTAAENRTTFLSRD